MSLQVDPVLERLIKVEVLNDVTRKDVAEIKTLFREMSTRLDKIDRDIVAAKSGGRVAWVIGGCIAATFGFLANHIPFLSSLPR